MIFGYGMVFLDYRDRTMISMCWIDLLYLPTSLKAELLPPTTQYGHKYITDYYLANDIYPSWVTFVKTILCPNGPKTTNFTAAQESARKDVERVFGVL